MPAPCERIVRQSGVVALAILSFVTAVNATILCAGVFFAFRITDRPDRSVAPAPFLLPEAAELFVYQVVAAGPSVLVCWGLQAGMGWWEPEPSWIDRAGRALSVLRILIEVCGLLDWLGRQ